MSQPIFQPVERPRRTSAPPWSLSLTDPGRAAVEFGLMLGTRPLRRTLPVGDGHPVLVLPGLLAGDGSTRPLRRILRDLGYQVHGWRLGRNIGPTAKAVAGMAERLDDLDHRYGAPISVIGWSLGGIFARGIARRRPSSVRQVITLGSPFRLTSHNQTRAGAAFKRFSHLHVERAPVPLELETEPLSVPSTSIYSKWDGVVALAGVHRPALADRGEHRRDQQPLRLRPQPCGDLGRRRPAGAAQRPVGTVPAAGNAASVVSATGYPA